MLRLTTKQVADLLGTQEWRVRRLFETGAVPEVERFAGRRMIDGDRFVTIVGLLIDREWISTRPADRYIQQVVAAIAAGDGQEARRQLQLLSEATDTHLKMGSDNGNEVQDV
jgi:hypothetical protein